jgi:putative colanic acid biosynthesis acetyltransferase WcaF
MSSSAPDAPSPNAAPGDQLDIERNRAAQKYPFGEMVRRVLWMMGHLFFRFSPRPFFGWRRFLLRLFGAEIGKGVNIYRTATVYFPWKLTVGDWSAIGEDAMLYNLGPITIGEQVTISQRSHLCAGTHDHTDPSMPLQKPPITVEDQAWVCADAFVGPGVTVGEGAIVGARAVAVKDIEAWDIVVGNPARVVGERSLDETPV